MSEDIPDQLAQTDEVDQPEENQPEQQSDPFESVQCYAVSMPGCSRGQLIQLGARDAAELEAIGKVSLTPVEGGDEDATA